jgi:hypothetical protein
MVMMVEIVVGSFLVPWRRYFSTYEIVEDLSADSWFGVHIYRSTTR